MIELSDQQRQTLNDGSAVRVIDNGREYVVLLPDVYERLREGSDSWTAEELDGLREEVVSALDRFGKDA